MSLLDVITLVIGGDPDAPAFAQLVREDYQFTGQFGDNDGAGGMRTSLRLRLGGLQSLFCPFNALVRRFPAAPGDLTEPDRKLLEQAMPALRDGDGKRITLADFRQDDLFLEVWPTAFRRLEQLVALADLPLAPGEPRLDQPQMPMPRWIRLRGAPFDRVRTAMEEIVAKQFSDKAPADRPKLDEFAAGRSTVLAAADDRLVMLATQTDVEVWMFDQAGLPIDPNYVFGTLSIMAEDGLFPYLRDLRRPDPTTVKSWTGPERHVVVMSDHEGVPYQPWNGDPPDPTPPRLLAIGTGTSPSPHTPNAQGVVIFTDAGEGDATYDELNNRLVSMLAPGEHARTALHPYGTLEAVTRVGFRTWTFVRLRVIDYGQWFPRRPEETAPNTPPPGGGGGFLLPRYTEGNEFIPIADGTATMREVYRAVRATYVDETYATFDDRPVGTPRTPADVAGTQVFLSNWSIAAHNPLLGVRGTLSVATTQPADAIPTAVDDLVGRLTMVPTFPYDLPGASGTPPVLGRQDYTWMATVDALPSGAWVEVRQLGVDDDFLADDPRIPGEDNGADTYGIVAPALDGASAAKSFVGSRGHFALPVVFDPDFSLGGTTPTLTANLRVIYWEADPDDPDPLSTATSGKGRERTRAFGQVALPFPASPLDPPPFPAGVVITEGASLIWEGIPGEAVVVLAPGSLTSDKIIVVVNSRTGETTAVDTAPNPGAEIRIPLTNVARFDRALVGFLPPGGNPAEADPSLCTHFFWLGATGTQQVTGRAPVHSTEVGGLAREAIAAGVDVRLLIWNNVLISDPLTNTIGMIRAVNALINGRRGAAFLDAFTREAGAHHQKPAFVRTPDDVIAFVGGIDQAPSRYDAITHRDPNPNRPSGLWHDLHCRLRGKAAWDVYRNFQHRWNATTARIVDPDVPVVPLPPPLPDDIDNADLTKADGTSAVQINRTIPRFVDATADFVNTDLGDLSALRSRERVFAQAKRFLYIEEQYFWSLAFATSLNARLRGPNALEFLFLVLPKVQSEFPPIDLALYATRRKALTMLVFGQESIEGVSDPTQLSTFVGDKVAVFNLINENDTPIYVHSKMIIADDLWMSVGSPNLNRRSMTYDSEIDAASIDGELRRGGHRTPRQFRAELLVEHLRLDADQAPMVEDPRDAFRLVKSVLAGERPELHPVGIIAHDFDKTHYNLDPGQAPPAFEDALRLGFDPDGTEPGHGITLTGLLSLVKTLAAATDTTPFGGVGRIDVTLEASAIPPPGGGAQLRARLRLALLPGGASPPEPLGDIGPFDPAQVANVGVVAVGETYRLSGDLFSTAAPDMIIATAGPVDFLASSFVVQQTLVF